MSNETRVMFVGNGVPQVGVIERTCKNGNVRVRTEDRFNAAGRRLEQGQTWSFTPEDFAKFVTEVR